MFKIGCHLSIASGFKAAALDINSINGNTFQYFSRNPRGGALKEWDEADFNEYLKLADEYGIKDILTHAPYTLNPASAKENAREFALICFKEDLERLEHFDNALYNFHPGSYTTIGLDQGMEYIINTLNEVMWEDMKTTILLETMSGKGTEIGRSFEEIKKIIDNVKFKDKIGVTIDTCHIYSAGYDIVNDLDGVINKFDEVIGLKYLKAIHLNDSMTPFNSNLDRHAKLGDGSIGIDAIERIINHPKLRDIPFYLETPNDLEGFTKEIELLKKLRKD